MNPPEMTLADAESILAQVLEHPNLTLSYTNHLLAREALRKLVEAGKPGDGRSEMADGGA